MPIVPRPTHVSIPFADYQAWAEAERINNDPTSRHLLEESRDALDAAVNRATNRNEAVTALLPGLRELLEGIDFRALQHEAGVVEQNRDLLARIVEAAEDPRQREVFASLHQSVSASYSALVNAISALRPVVANRIRLSEMATSLGDTEDTTSMATLRDQIHTHLNPR